MKKPLKLCAEYFFFTDANTVKEFSTHGSQLSFSVGCVLGSYYLYINP